jgi:hypothetical protein
MFDFLRRSGVQRPSDGMRQALEASGLPAETDMATLGVVESRGPYAGRTVTYFRVFDQVRAVTDSADVFSKHLGSGHAYRSLDAHPELVLRAGFREQDGTVVINQHQS